MVYDKTELNVLGNVRCQKGLIRYKSGQAIEEQPLGVNFTLIVYCNTELISPCKFVPGCLITFLKG